MWKNSSSMCQLYVGEEREEEEREVVEEPEAVAAAAASATKEERLNHIRSISFTFHLVCAVTTTPCNSNLDLAA